MAHTQTKGWLEITNIKKYRPFQVEFEDLGNAIQVDVTGTGLLNFRENLSPELELEIHTCILTRLREYADQTGHDCAQIGYQLNLIPSKKLNRTWGVFETSVDLTIIFQKPVQNATAYQLQPSIDLLTSLILGEVFILSGTC